ncbi:Tetratricopeptide repeat-domain-containing protein [Diplogelasinospora grovesii]|uniref:Tetratricopeptide repeat-domain-containing protein n=1 Tax=Diplogelasinospora grovesii TaxID=303347 RepID=A0AAN6RZ35_9PEZI|nr:Tetratricopeptide repeat-domain-containing protein [Diplogelasinospora grovesii]
MDEAGRELLGLLDGLPLALAQAASYIRETGLDTASYVRLYKQQWDDLMRCDGESGLPLIDYEQGSVGTTWTAFIDSRDLWHGLLQAAADGGEQWPGWLCEIAGNEVRYLDAARLLLRYSMIEAQESVQGSHMMHPVVHRWASHIQDGAAKREVLRLAVMVVGSSVPSSALYADQGRLTEAESMYQRALEGKEKALGRDHTSTLDTVNNLGNLYADQGRLTEAESMYQRALSGFQTALGPHWKSQLVMRNMDSLQHAKGIPKTR